MKKYGTLILSSCLYLMGCNGLSAAKNELLSSIDLDVKIAEECTGLSSCSTSNEILSSDFVVNIRCVASKSVSYTITTVDEVIPVTTTCPIDGVISDDRLKDQYFSNNVCDFVADESEIGCSFHYCPVSIEAEQDSDSDSEEVMNITRACIA